MNSFLEMITDPNVNLVGAIFKLALSLVLGSVIGLERRRKGQIAGMRTFSLICMGATLAMLVSIYIPQEYMGLKNGDPGRIAAQVISGIGFIGGGTVLRHGATVVGLTTAATLFMSASIGMACGAGMYDLAIIATIFSVLILVIVRRFEKDVLPSSTKNFKRLKVTLNCVNEKATTIYDMIIDKYEDLKEISKKLSKSEENITKINVILDVKSKKPVQEMYKEFQSIEGIESISIQEFCEN